MRDAVEMWRNTRMAVLTALCAALYAALLIPFKAIVLIPGLTEVRPASALPVMLALLFGPAAAWGAAFGNLIGDFFGTLTPGSFFGFIGNFLFAYVPWRLWLVFTKKEAEGSLRQWPLFVFISIVAACCCAVVIAWGVDLLGLAPYHILGTIISLNNTLPTIVLGSALLRLLYYRARRWGLLATQNLSPHDLAPGKFAPLGAALVVIGSLAGVALALVLFRMPASSMLPFWLKPLGSARQTAGICVLLIGAGVMLLARPVSRIRLQESIAVSEASAIPFLAEDATNRALPVFVDHLTFSYPEGSRPAIHDICLTLEKGQWLTIVGPTGAGKSTLCLSLCGVIPQLQIGDFSGRVCILGQDTRHTTVHELALFVGTLFQHFESQLFCTDVESEIAFALEQRGVPREEMRQHVDEALAIMKIEHLRDADPALLSGGEKQRLALASLIAADPAVLVLDEPTTDIDPQGRQELMALLKEWSERGKTIVLVENDLWPPQSEEQILALYNGQICMQGPAEELLRNPQRCREIGLRPLPLPELFALLGRPERPLTVAEALAAVHLRPFCQQSACGQAQQRPDSATMLSSSSFSPKASAPKATQPTTGEIIISVDELSHTYNGFEALHDISLHIRRGEFVAILGANGAGKTTLARHLNGLLKPTQGRVLVAGQDTRQATPAQLSRFVGYLFQDPDDEIFCRRVEEEIAFGLRNQGLAPAEIKKRTQEALEWMGLLDVAAADPFTLTRGERQLVALAAVLAMRPDVIVFDEPTTGLDGLAQEQMLERLRQLNRAGHTIIMITHATWAAAAYAQRIILMGEGKIIADAAPREIFAHEEWLYAAHQTLPDIVAFSRQAFGQIFLSVPEAVERLKAFTKKQ